MKKPLPSSLSATSCNNSTFWEALLSTTFLNTLQHPLHQQYKPYRLSDFGQSAVFIKRCKDMSNSRRRRNYKMPPQGELNWELSTCLSPGGAQLWCTTRPVCVCTGWALARCHWGRELARSPLISADRVVNRDDGGLGRVWAGNLSCHPDAFSLVLKSRARHS